MALSSESPLPWPALLAARLRYFWTLIVAAICFLILGIPLVVIGYCLRAIFGIEDVVFPFARFGARLYLSAAGARTIVTGLHHLNHDETYLFVANHQSNLDPPLIFCYVGQNVGALAKKELRRVPVLGQGMALAHIIPIDRSNRERAIESTRAGATELRRGHSLMAFPEGTRSPDGRMREFKKGVFFMALEAGVSIVPIAINGTRLVMPKGKSVSIPGTVSLEILPPVSTAGWDPADITGLVEEVAAAIRARVLN
jgi:1-acyl-sn-glycerol-3-phosphate acyltransferase